MGLPPFKGWVLKILIFMDYVPPPKFAPGTVVWNREKQQIHRVGKPYWWRDGFDEKKLQLRGAYYYDVEEQGDEDLNTARACSLGYEWRYDDTADEDHLQTLEDHARELLVT